MIDIKSLLFATLLSVGTTATAQTQLTSYRPGLNAEGAVYFLPKTELRVLVQVEKTTETPGDFHVYAKRFLRVDDAINEKSVSHKVNSIKMYTVGTADKSKAYSVKINFNSTATNMEFTKDGVLLAINDKGQKISEPARFKPAPKPRTVDPRKYLNQEILAAGSTSKMAELTAQEIYAIRESINELTRGEADYMPKDGAQLKIMLDRLDQQDKSLTGMFCGTVEKDTVEYMLSISPDKDIPRQVLFRLSQQLGMVDADDLSGVPYYISIEDMHSLPSAVADSTDSKKGSIFNKPKKYESGIFVNVPGKAKITISQGNQKLLTQEISTAQFGHTELLGAELFKKKIITKLTLNPITGAVDKLEAVEAEEKKK